MPYTMPGVLEDGVVPVLKAREHEDSWGLLPGIVAVPIVFMIVYLIAVILRIYSRLKYVKSLGYDDYWIILATIFALPTSVMTIYLATQYQRSGSLYSGGYNLDELIAAAKIYYVVQILLPLVLGTVKISILTLYLRLSPSIRFRRVVFGSMVLVVTTTLASLLMWTFSCIPVSTHWDLVAIITGEFLDYCPHILDVCYLNVALNMATDVWVWVLPIPMILRLTKLSRREKLVVLAIMSGGFIACLASIGRVVSLWDSEKSASMTALQTGNLSCLISFAMVEMCLGILTSSMPALKPVLQKSFPRILNSINRRSRFSDQDFAAHGDERDSASQDSRKLDSSASSNDTISLGVLKGNEKLMRKGILKGSPSNSTMNSTTPNDTLQDIDLEAGNAHPTTTSQNLNPLISSTPDTSNNVPTRSKNTVTIVVPPSERPQQRSRQGSLWNSFQSTISRKIPIGRENTYDNEYQDDQEPIQRVNETNEQHEEAWNLSVNDFCVDPNLEHAVPYDMFDESGTSGDVATVRKREVNPLILFLREEEGKKSAAAAVKNRINLSHQYLVPGDMRDDDNFDKIEEIDCDDQIEEREMASSNIQHQNSHEENYSSREVWRGDRLSV